MRTTLPLIAALFTLAAAPAATAVTPKPPPLSGPPGTSASKVLVIGTDGTRFDLVQKVIEQGGAPRLEGIARDGFAVPSLLAYAPPEAATISEVGWVTIATGVWPRKHRVTGAFLNMDPNQDTKNGYPDFLTRIEQVRPKLSTFIATNWANLGLHQNGGPIFGDGIDARSAVAAENDIESWDQSDQDIADVTARYLRNGNPDAGFVYFGIVDEVAHLDGSANPRYLQAIRDTDRRIGQLLDAIRARPTYLAERWTVIVTTDHGQQNLSQPSVLSHGFGSDLERMAFVASAGFGIEGLPTFKDIRVVDIASTVFARLGVPIDSGWKLDGRPFATAAPAPEPTAKARRRGRSRLRLLVRAPQGSPVLRRVKLRLPKGVRARRALAKPSDGVRLFPRRVRIKTTGARRLRVRLRVRTRRGARAARRVRLVITDAAGVRTKLRVRVR